jgi:putative FmdB family regulatory protein
VPLYEFKCKDCGKEFESYRRLTDAGKEEACPVCGSRAERMRISLFSTSGSSSSGGSSCQGGSRRSPFS